MLIDHYLPQYDVRACYEIAVRAPWSRVYRAARELDFQGSRIARALFKLRGLPEGTLSLEGMLRWGFVLLAEEPEQEFVLGLVGRFWVRSPHIISVPATSFIDFSRPGLAKAVMNLAFFPGEAGTVRLATETRVFCPDEATRRSFRRYWRLIGPFSGLIRKEWLRLIKKQAESLAESR